MPNCPSSNNRVIIDLYDQYQNQRIQLQAEYIKNVQESFKTAIESKDDRNLWKLIDWSGNLKHNAPKAHPSMNVMSERFISLYEPIKDDGDLSTLHSDVYIPLTDDNNSMNEIHESFSQMKKGGYDYSVPMLFLVLTCIAPTVLHLLNAMFFTGFPLKLCTAQLSVISKPDNILFSKYYRGLNPANLCKFIRPDYRKQAYEMGKNQPRANCFRERNSGLIIGLIKYNKRTLYIGFIDLSKAFNNFSRFLLLKTLAKMGIGTFMLESLKSWYSTNTMYLKVHW